MKAECLPFNAQLRPIHQGEYVKQGPNTFISWLYPATFIR